MRAQEPAREDWPEDYQAPTLEPLGSVWDLTAGRIGLGSDLILLRS
jgi:hypothetical protein